MWRSVDGELLNVNNSSECTHTGKHCGREEAARLPVNETVGETRAGRLDEEEESGRAFFHARPCFADGFSFRQPGCLVASFSTFPRVR